MNILFHNKRIISKFSQKNVFQTNLASKLNIPYRQNLQIRYYARTSRRPTTTTKEDETTTQETGLWGQQPQKQKPEYITTEEPEEGADGTTEDDLTPEMRRHFSKVYGLLMAGAGLSTVGVLAATFAPMLTMPAMIAAFVPVLAVSFMSPTPERRTLRQNLFLSAAFLLGMGISPLVLTSSPGAVFAALMGTSAIFGGFSLAALKAKKSSMLMLGGVLGGGLLVILAASLAHLLLPLLGVTNPAFLAMLYNINLYGGLGLFSLYICYDTQNMAQQFKDGNEDHVQPALSMFLNLFNIFVRLLAIFRND
jgi:FtsH-binding integral membrane protein